MLYYNLSASAFADKIGVQRSGISHILSGRNKPSLEFVMKLHSYFPEVSLYWLLNGKGEFPSSVKLDQINTNLKVTDKKTEKHKPVKADDTIERIVIFF